MNCRLQRPAGGLLTAFAFAAFLFGQMSAAACARPLGIMTLSPKVYSSPTGRYSLKVVPSDEYGRRGAKYRVAEHGSDIWSDHLTFTLWDAAITDCGVVAGYAYTYGPYGRSPEPGDESSGEFLVVIFDSNGTIRVSHSTKRRATFRFEDALPEPVARGLIMDPDNDRFVVRIADSDENRRAETWWVYRLSTGAEIARLQPKLLMADRRPARFVIDAQPVAGTPLTLLHWWRYDDRKESTVGARFTLVDLSAKPVWSLDLERDYEVPSDEVAEKRLRDFIGRQGALLRVGQAGQFDLFFAAKSQRVNFSVKQDQHRNWVVSEVAREPYSISRHEPQRSLAPQRPLK